MVLLSCQTRASPTVGLVFVSSTGVFLGYSVREGGKK
jgi:hypothetical protein